MTKFMKNKKCCLPRLRGLPHSYPLSLSPCPFLRRGFALIELITVLAILSLLIATALGGYFAWNQTSALRGATDLTLSSLNRARQFAITHRVETHFKCENVYPSNFAPTATLYVYTNSPLGEPVYITLPQALPKGATLDAPPQYMDHGTGFSVALVSFFPSGRPEIHPDWFSDDGNIPLVITLERPNAITRTNLIDILTGHVRPVPR